MNRWILTGSLAGALALPLLLAPATASASCHDRQVTGTVVGGVGGALIGNSIAHGGGGALLGGLGGAVLGHEVARGSCGRDRYPDRHAAYRHGYRSHEGEATAPAGYSYDGEPAPAQNVAYYDHRGTPISPVTSSQGPAGPPTAPACGAETRSYYDDRGELVQQQVQTCPR